MILLYLKNNLELLKKQPELALDFLFVIIIGGIFFSIFQGLNLLIGRLINLVVNVIYFPEIFALGKYAFYQLVNIFFRYILFSIFTGLVFSLIFLIIPIIIKKNQNEGIDYNLKKAFINFKCFYSQILRINIFWGFIFFLPFLIEQITFIHFMSSPILKDLGLLLQLIITMLLFVYYFFVFLAVNISNIKLYASPQSSLTEIIRTGIAMSIAELKDLKLDLIIFYFITAATLISFVMLTLYIINSPAYIKIPLLFVLFFLSVVMVVIEMIMISYLFDNLKEYNKFTS